MSAGGAFGGNRGARPVPPEKGVFPLDHMHLCDLEKKEYISCLKSSGHKSDLCRHLSKMYLECRMKKSCYSRRSYCSSRKKTEKEKGEVCMSSTKPYWEITKDNEPSKTAKKIESQLEYVENTNMGNQLHENSVVVSHSVSCKEDKIKNVYGTAGEASTVFMEHDLIVPQKQTFDDIVEVDHIDFIISENLLEPPSHANQFSMFFGPKLVFLKKCRRFVQLYSYMVLAFYKTRGRVFSNKGRMMGNKIKENIYIYW